MAKWVAAVIAPWTVHPFLVLLLITAIVCSRDKFLGTTHVVRATKGLCGGGNVDKYKLCSFDLLNILTLSLRMVKSITITNLRNTLGVAKFFIASSTVHRNGKLLTSIASPLNSTPRYSINFFLSSNTERASAITWWKVNSSVLLKRFSSPLESRVSVSKATRHRGPRRVLNGAPLICFSNAFSQSTEFKSSLLRKSKICGFSISSKHGCLNLSRVTRIRSKGNRYNNMNRAFFTWSGSSFTLEFSKRTVLM